MRLLLKLTIPALLLLYSCGALQIRSTPSIDPTRTAKEEETATLLSMKQVDNYPLYTMRYVGSYKGRVHSHGSTALGKPMVVTVATGCHATWGCPLFLERTIQ